MPPTLELLPFRPVSSNPSNMRPGFDMLEELRDNPAAYRGDRFLSIYSLPPVLRASLQRIRNISPATPSKSMTLCCALEGGLRALRRSPGVRQLSVATQRFYQAPTNSDPVMYEELADLFDHFQIKVGIGASGFEKGKVQIRVSEPIHLRLQSLADDLGASNSQVAILAIAVCATQQPEILESHKSSLESTIRKLDERLAVRLRILEALVGLL